jgi:hypothetical protein
VKNNPMRYEGREGREREVRASKADEGQGRGEGGGRGATDLYTNFQYYLGLGHKWQSILN